MYCGIKLDVSVHDYASAYQALAERAKRSKVRGADVLDPTVRREAPLGHSRSQVTGIRLLGDGSIACRLYRTDVVTWHPDNSVTVATFPTVTTAAFANALLPTGLSLGGASEMMTFFPGCDRASSWSDRWRAAHVCHGAATYRQVDGVWLPDTDTVSPMRLTTLNKAVSREVCKQYPFAAFKQWLFAACPLLEPEHQGTDYCAAAEALWKRDFRAAAVHLPPVEVPRGFGTARRIKPLAFRNVRWNGPITLSSVEYLRRYLYAEHGAYSCTEVISMTCTEYERQRQLERQLENVGAYLCATDSPPPKGSSAAMSSWWRSSCRTSRPERPTGGSGSAPSTSSRSRGAMSSCSRSRCGRTIATCAR